MGAMSLGGKIAYHLFDIKYDSRKSNSSVELLRKSRWPSQYNNDQGISELLSICFLKTDF